MVILLKKVILLYARKYEGKMCKEKILRFDLNRNKNKFNFFS